LAGAALALSVLLSTAYPLLDPDEGRNAEVMREMSSSGSILIPTLADMPYLDKPPAFFAAGALAMRLCGATPLGARLPSAIAGAVTLWLLGLCVVRRLSQRTALTAIGLLATAPLFAILSTYVIFDMSLTLCVTALWLLISEELERGPGVLRRLAMFAAVTAGVLIKGPVMLAWALGGSLGAALLVRDRAPLRWLAWGWGWMLLLGVAGGWFAWASSRFPEYPHYAFIEESFERMSTGSFHREQPPWFVPLVLVTGALPWSLATPWTPRLSQWSRVGLGFVLFAVVFFTLSRSKLATYLLPCFPPLALAAGEAWTAPHGARRGAWRATLLYAALAGLLAFTAAGGISPAKAPAFQDIFALAGPLAAALALLAALVSLGIVAKRAELAMIPVLAFTPVVLWIAGPALAGYARMQSGEPLGRAISAVARGGAVRFERCYSAGAQFALGRSVDLLSDRGSETTSTYQERYRDTLLRRGQWRPRSEVPSPDPATVIVRPARSAPVVPPGTHTVFQDARFVAYARGP